MLKEVRVDNETAGEAEEPLRVGDAAGGKRDGRRAFVEPEVSFPIDVLESTTYFQFTESGATN